jgi:hypothetical protein
MAISLAKLSVLVMVMAGMDIYLCDKIFYLIHSFLRSSQLLGVAEKYSGLLDGMVLMSSAPDVPSLLTSFAASSIGIASLNNKNCFGEQGPTTISTLS